MIQLPAIVKASSYIGGFPGAINQTMVALVAPPDFDYSGEGIEWPLTLFLFGDVKEQNLPGTKYKITIERVDETD